MAEGERHEERAKEEVDYDRVDLSWLTSGLRRAGLLRPPRPAGERRRPDVDRLDRGGPTEPTTEERDYDRVDFGWLTTGLRRAGLLRPPPPPPVEQLAFFDAGTAPRRRPRPQWWPDIRSDTRSDTVPGGDSLPSTILADPRARLLLVASMLGWILLYLHWTFRQHNGLGTQAFDIGIFDQGVWLLSRFKRPFVTVNGRNLFGDHTSFLLLPFAAVYWVIPSIKVLLAAQTLALGSGALATFLIARDKLRSELLAAFLAVAYLLQPVLGWANLNEGFHPDAFEIPLVLFAFWFLLRHRWVGYWICVAALLLVKEDVAVLTFALGVYVALRHDRRVGLITCGVSVAYLMAAFWVIIPAFLGGGGTVYSGRLVFGGPTQLLKKVFTDPGEVIREVGTRTRAWYLWQLFAPVGFLAWLAPGVLLVAIGPLLLNLFSGFGYQFDVRYHYSTLILPVIIVATILGVASAPRRNHAPLVGVVVAASLVCGYLWSPTPNGRVHPYIADPTSTAVVSFEKAEALLPSDAVVSAYYGFVPQISHRDEVYVFPNPWKASYWGRFDKEGQRLPQADRVEYIFVRSNLDPDPKAVFDSISDEFETVYRDDEVQLLKRR